MTSVAQTRDFVVGVDTHARSYTYAVLATSTGQTLGVKQFPSTPAGTARALNWVGKTTGGRPGHPLGRGMRGDIRGSHRTSSCPRGLSPRGDSSDGRPNSTRSRQLDPL